MFNGVRQRDALLAAKLLAAVHLVDLPEGVDITFDQHRRVVRFYALALESGTSVYSTSGTVAAVKDVAKRLTCRNTGGLVTEDCDCEICTFSSVLVEDMMAKYNEEEA